MQGQDIEGLEGGYEETEDLSDYPDAPRGALGSHDSMPQAPTSQLPSSYGRKENTSNVSGGYTPSKTNGHSGRSGPQAVAAI